MDLSRAPVNISLMDNDRRVVKHLKPVTVSSFYDGNRETLHDDGLFSTTIFGRSVEPRRSRTFSYINLNTQIMHPLLYRNIEKLASWYTLIMLGKEYATWNDETKAFEKSNEVDGETGYGFFMKHFPDLQFEKNDSIARNLRVDVVDKFRVKGIYDFVLVLPAGLRDIEVNDRGVVRADEVNGFYQALVGLSKNINKAHPEDKFNDSTKMLMQRNFNAIFELLFSYLSGKTGLTQSKFMKRRVEHGTRSVMTAQSVDVEDLIGPQVPRINETVVGLLQVAKGTIPKVVYAFGQSFINEMIYPDGTAQVMDPKTYELKEVKLDPKERDMFTTPEGINDLINLMAVNEIKAAPITVGGGYPAMIYQTDDKKHIRVVRDITRVPQNLIKKLRPITLVELVYYITAPHIDRTPVWTTRFPVSTNLSTSPSFTYLTVTDVGDVVTELNDSFEPVEGEFVYREWPRLGKDFVDTIAIHPNLLKGKGGDHDGDTSSADFTYSNESVKEMEEFYDDVENLFDGNRLVGAFSTDTVEWTLRAMTTPLPE